MTNLQLDELQQTTVIYEKTLALRIRTAATTCALCDVAGWLRLVVSFYVRVVG